MPTTPIATLDIELSQALPDLPATDAAGRRYAQARALVRFQGRPLGLVDLRLDAQGLAGAAVAAQVWDALGPAINAELRRNKLPELHTLPAAGLPALPSPDPLSAADAAPLVTVIVCTRDRSEQLAGCLGTLMSLDYPNYELLVVDNAPRTGDSAALVQQYAGRQPCVRYVCEPRPGLSWARNCGLHHARGGIVAFTDDDVRADPRWLSALVAGFAAAPNVACVTGLTLAAELETPAQVWFEQFGGFTKGRAMTRRIYDLDQNRPAHPLYPYLAAHFGAGVNMAFRTAVIRALGGFDTALGAGAPAPGAEDIEAFFRVIMRGHTLVYEPAALLRHFHRRDMEGLRKQLYGYGVGFTAFLTRCLLDDPRRLVYLLRKLPAALDYLSNASSERNQQRDVSFPPELNGVELRGMVYGPLAYLRGRWQARRITKQYAALSSAPGGTVGA